MPVINFHLENNFCVLILDLHCLGVCLLALNNPGDAETSFRKAVDIREQYLVANDKRTGECK